MNQPNHHVITVPSTRGGEAAPAPLWRRGVSILGEVLTAVGLFAALALGHLL